MPKIQIELIILENNSSEKLNLLAKSFSSKGLREKPKPSSSQQIGLETKV